MIDFTTIQANPIPLEVIELQKAKVSLASENKTMKVLLCIGAGAIVIYGIYKIFNEYKEDDINRKK
jgi:hypothetical protein